LEELALPTVRPAGPEPASRAARHFHDDHLYVGGLRRSSSTLAKVPGLRLVGAKVGKAFDDFAADNDFMLGIAEKFGNPDFTGPSEEQIVAWREHLRRAVNAPPERSHNETWRRRPPLQAQLLGALLAQGGDPETCLVTWIEDGVPLGGSDAYWSVRHLPSFREVVRGR